LHLADVYAGGEHVALSNFARRLGMIELAQSRAERHKNAAGHYHVVALAPADDAMEDGSNSMAARTRELVMATRVVM
jgi:hypothetical protein